MVAIRFHNMSHHNVHVMMLICLSPRELELIIVSRESVHFQPVVKDVLDQTSDDDLGWLWLSLPYLLNSLPTILSMIVLYKWIGRDGIIRLISFARNVPSRVHAVNAEFNEAVAARDVPAAINAVGSGLDVGLEAVDLGGRSRIRH